MSKTVQELSKETLETINENTRTIIVATLNHNGAAKVTMIGQDLDLTWLSKLIDLRLNDLVNSKKEI